MILYAITLVFYGTTLGFLALEDMRRFEIKLELLPFTALAGIFLATYSGLAIWDILAGALIWGIPVALYYWFHPGRIGRGDIWLFVTAGFCLGVSGSILGALIFGLASIVTAWAYAHARGKRFGCSIYPAAVPICTALLAVCILRVFRGLVADDDMLALLSSMLGLPVVGVILGLTFNTWITSNLEKSHD
jgi:ABC-type glycerol-3-phosphate transport system permease component